MRKLSLLFTFLFMLVASLTMAQVSNADFTITLSPPGGIIPCDVNNTAENVRIVPKKTGLGSFKITFTLPTGIEHTGTFALGAAPAGFAVTLDAASTPTVPVFNVTGTWATGQPVNFTFTRRAACASINYSIGGGVFKDAFSASYTGGTASPLVDTNPAISPYVLNVAVLSVQTIATANANLGDTITPRNVTVVQGGTGRIQRFTHKVVIADTVATIDYVLSYGGTPLVPNASSTADTLYYDIDFSLPPFNTSTAATSGTPANYFHNGETLTFQESFKVQRCDAEPVRHFAQYGCNAGEVCYISASQPGNVIFGSELPNITFAYTAASDPASTMYLCDTNYVEVVVTNTNTTAGAAATDVLLVIGRGGNNVNPSTYDGPALYEMDNEYSYSNYAVNGIPVPAIYWRDIAELASAPGTWNPRVAIMDTLTFDPDGAGVGLEDLDGDGYYDDLGPGQSFTFSYKIVTNQLTADNACVPMNTGWDKHSYKHNYIQQVHKTQCGTPRIGKTLDKFYANFGKYVQVSNWNVPTDIDGPAGEDFTVTIYPNFQRSGWRCGGTADEIYQVRIPLPAGIYYDGVTLPNLPASLNPTYFMDGDTLVYQLEGDNVAGGRYFDFPLTIDCSIFQSTRLTLSYETRFICDGCLEWKLNCGVLPTINTHCPDPCKGPRTLGFDANRTTAGWTDQTKTTKVVLDPNVHSTKDYLAGDTMHIETYMVMQDTSVTDLQFWMSYSGSPVLEFANGTGTITIDDISSAGGPYTAALPAPVYTNSGTHYYKFDLSSFASIVSPTYDYGDGNEADTVWLSFDMVVPKTPVSTSPMTLVNFRGRFLSINPGIDTVSCDYYGDVANISIPRVYNTQWFNNVTFNECGGNAYFTNTIRSEIYGVPSFPGEYRPYIQLNSMTFQLPEYVEYIPNSATIDGTYTGTLSGANVITSWNVATRILTVEPAPGAFIAPQFALNILRANIGLDVKCGAPSALASTALNSDGNVDLYIYNPAVQENKTYTGNLSNLYTFNQPTYTLQSPLPVSQGVQSDISWDIQIDKTSSGNVGYNWLRIERLPGIDIQGVYAVSGTTETLLTSTTQGGFVYAQLGAFNGLGIHNFRIKADYTTCANVSFDVNIGWGCQGYPTDYNSVDETYCYEDVLTLGLEPKGSIVEIEVDPLSTTVPVTMCDPFEIDMTLFSPGEANVENPNISFRVPGGVTGLTIDSAVVEYPANSGNRQTVSTSIVGADIIMNLMDHDTINDRGGIYGTVKDPSVDGRTVQVTLYAQTTCDFIANSAIKFVSYGEQPCSGLATGSGDSDLSAKIAITGATNDYEVFHTIVPPVLGIQGCSESDTLEFISTIYSGTGGTTGNEDSIRITLPANVEYVSHTCDSAVVPTFVSSTNVGGLVEVLFAIPAGVGTGQTFNIDMEVTSFKGCDGSGEVQISSFVAIAGVLCNGTPCSNLLLETGNERVGVAIEKPEFEFTNVEVTSVQQGVASEIVTIAYEVENIGNYDANELAVKVYYDANFNGLLDVSDILVYSETPYAVAIPAAGTFDTTVVATINAGRTCPLLIQIDTSICGCAYDIEAITDVPLMGNAGTDTLVCSDASVGIGLPPLSGYSYEWTGQMAGATFTNPYTSLTTYNAGTVTTATSDTVYLQTYRPSGCASIDTLIIDVKPLPVVAISPEDTAICQGDFGVLSASPTGVQYTYLWSNAQTTQSISVNTAGSYTVTITDTSSTCSASETTSVTTLPAPTASITSSNAAMCANDAPRTLTGTPSGGTFGVNGTAIAGSSFNPATYGAGTHTIFYAVSNASGCVDTAFQSIEIKALPNVSFSFGDTSICLSSGLLDLTATPVTATFSGTGVSGTQFNPNTGSTGVGVYNIYAVATVNGCTAIDTVEITVTDAPAAPTSGGDTAYCAGDPIPAISATPPAGMTINWYNSVGNLLASNTNTYTPTIAGTYYAETRDTTGDCSSLTRTAIAVTENPLPAAPTSGGNQTICITDAPATLTVTTVAGTTVEWFSDAALTTSVGTGLTYTTSTAGTYYAVATNTTTNCESNATAVTLTISAAPTGVSAGANDSLCTPAGTPIQVTLAATGTGDTGEWNQVGPNPSVGINGSTNPNQDVDLLPRASAYQFEWCVTNGACQTCDTVAVTVNTSPAVTLSSPGATCTMPLSSGVYSYPANVSAGTVTSLHGTVTGTAPNYTITGVPVGTNDTLISTTATCADSLFVTTPNCVCPTIEPPTSGGPQSACVDAGAWPTISASATGTGGNAVDWYAAATGGTALTTGSNTYTPSGALTAGVHCYYAESRNTTSGCVSYGRTEVCITISALPTANAGNDTTFDVATGVTHYYDLNATAVGGTGTWTQVGTGPNLGIDGSHNHTPSVGLTSPHVYTLEWCVANANCTVCDTVILTIETANTPPVAVNDNTTTDEDTPTTINVLTNDNDSEGPLDTTTVAQVLPGAGPNNGSVLDNGDGTFTYTPNPDFVGTDQFTYTVCDTGAPVLCDTAVVTITVTSVPDTLTSTTPEETPVTECMDNYTNFANPITSVAYCGLPDNGTLDNTVLPCVEYTPDDDFTGNDTACIIVCSGAVCDTVIWIIEVTPVNDPPVAVDDVDETDEDTPVTTDVLDNDTDLEGPLDTNSVAVVTLPPHGNVAVNPDGTITYTPDPNFVGTDVYTYTVCDTGMPVLCDTAQVTITVNPVTDTIPETTCEECPVELCVETDFVGPITSTNTCSPTTDNGTVTTSTTTGCVTYTPDEDYVGNDTVCVVVCSGSICDTTIFTITVTPVNDPPVAVNDVDETDEDTPVTTDVLNNDTDLEGPLDTNSVAVVTLPPHGNVSVGSDGTITYTPDPNFVGTDVYTYTVCDTGMPVLCDTATVTITVNPVTDTIPETTCEECPVELCVETDFVGPITSTMSCDAPEHGTTVASTPGCLTYTPSPNYNGPDTTCIVVCSGSICDTTIFTITVTPVNDPPVAVNDVDVTDEDTPVTTDVLNNDHDLEGPIDTSSVAVIGNPSHGSVAVNPDGTITYTPAPDFVGTDVYTYTVCDTGMPVLCDTAQVTITVNPVTDTIPETTCEECPIPICVETEFVNPITSINSCSPTSSIGTVTTNTTTGCMTYTPDPDTTGNDTVCVVVCSGSVCDTTIFTITVTPVNDNIVIRDDVDETDEDTPVTTGVLTNDHDIDGPLDTASLAVVTQPEHGSATVVAGTDSIQYIPDANYVGVDVYTYTVCDTGMPVLCDTAQVTITVNPVTDTIPETTCEECPVPLCVETVFDGAITSTSQCDDPDNGSLTSLSPGCLTYTPDPNFNGNDTACIIVCSGNVCDTTIFVITVTPVNDPPVAVNDVDETDEDTPVTTGVLTNDHDIDGPLDTASLAVVTQPEHGSATVVAGTDSIQYIPDANYVGTDVYTYTVCDTGMPVLCDTAQVTITVNPVTDTIPETTCEECPVELCVETDFGGLPITGTYMCDAPDHGTLVSSTPGCMTYTPSTNYNGPDTTCIIVCSGNVCDTTIFTITVTPVNDPPVAVNDVDETDEDTPVTTDVLNNDHDLEGPLDTSSVAVVTNPGHGSATPNPVTGEITYVPDPNYVGTDVYTYTVCDTGMPVLCDTAQVTITVNPVTDTIPETTPEETPVELCVETDFGGLPITGTYMCDAPDHGTLVSSTPGCMTYTPSTNYNGPDTTCIIVCTGSVCDTTIFTITVTPVNDPPIAKDDNDETDEDTPVVIDVTPNDTDIDGVIDPTTADTVSGPTHGTVVPNGNGTFTYTPDPNYVGTDQFTYTICDDGMPVLCDTAVVVITINPVTDTIPETTCEECPVELCVETDFGGLPITGTYMCDAPDNGTLTASTPGCMTYTPDTDYNGGDTACIVVCSGTVCDTTIFTITVTPVNDPPVAVNDVDETDEDTPVTTDVLDNDYDIDGPLDTTSVAVVGGTPANADSVVVNPDGTITLYPTEDFVGTITYTYQVCDTGMPIMCDTATVTVTINPVADTTYVTVPEDSVVTVCLDSVTNIGNITSVNFCNPPDNGSVLTAGLLPCLEYAPNPDYYGPDTVCLIVCSATACDTTILVIDVTPVIDDPVLTPIDDICETAPIPALTGTTEPYTTINWFDANDNLVGTGSPVTPATLALGENCFYAVAVHDTIPGLMGDTVSVCFNVDSLPENVYAGPDDTVCGFVDYELQATGDGQLNAWTQLVGPTVALDFDNPNAVVNLQPQGGTGQSNIYTFVWTNQNGLCSVSDTVVLTVTQPHITNAGNDTTICLPQAGGSVQLDATLSPLGTGYWVYNGAGTIAFADSTDPQTTVSGLIPYVNPTSTYRFYWYEVIGDCVARDEVLVTVNEAAEIVGLADADTNCLHSDYVLTAEVTAVNTPGYSWRINSPTGVVVSENMDGIVSPTVNTTYYIVATTVFGSNICRSIDSITINVDGVPSVVDDGCYDLVEDESFTGNTADWATNDDYAAVITGVVEYEVVSSSVFDYPSTLEIDNASGTFTFTPYPDMSGADTATVIAYNANCPELTATFTVCFNIEGVADEPINANNDTSTAIAQQPVDISLFDNDELNDNAVSSNTTVITDPEHGTVTVTDSENGIVTYVSDDEYARVDSFQYVVCQTLVDGEVLCDSAWVYVYIDGDIFIPEGFTPNGDGTNDAFVIPDLDRLYPDATLKVFNRWGDEVWNSQGPYRNNFVGRNFNGNQLPDGTYFYILHLNNGSGRNMASYVVIYR